MNSSMNADPSERQSDERGNDIVRKRRSYWGLRGGRSLGLSLAVHATLLLLATIWVVSTTVSRVDGSGRTFVSSRPGRPEENPGRKGGDARREESTRRIQAPPKVEKRIASKLPSTRLSILESPAPLPSSGLLSKSGKKAWAGRTDVAASGKGSGRPTAPPFVSGAGGPAGSASAFGRRGGTQFDGLTGTFYDLSLNSKGVPKTGSDAQRRTKNMEAVCDFLWRGNWDSKVLSSSYYRAPEKLVCQQFWLPERYSGEAPTAFGVTLSSGSPQWLIHYQAMIEAPDETAFRFVGSGRDCFWIRWDGKEAVGACYSWIGAHMTTDFPEFGQTCPDSFTCKPPKDGYKDIADHFRISTRESRRYDFGAMVTALKKHPGATHREFVQGSLRAGPWIQPKKGRRVPFEILLGTIGDRCEVFLAIERAAGPKSPKGAYVGTGKLLMFRCGKPEKGPQAPSSKAQTENEIEDMGPVFMTS